MVAPGASAPLVMSRRIASATGAYCPVPVLAIADAFRNSTPGLKGRALPGPDDYEQVPALAERGRARAARFFEMLDRHLAGCRFVAGDRYTIADIHLFRLFWRFVDALHPARGDYPNLYAHYDRMMQRPAVRKTLEVEAGIGYHLP